MKNGATIMLTKWFWIVNQINQNNNIKKIITFFKKKKNLDYRSGADDQTTLSDNCEDYSKLKFIPKYKKKKMKKKN